MQLRETQMTFRKRLMLCTGLHAVFLVPVILLNLGAGLVDEPGFTAVNDMADFLAYLFCLPIMPLIPAERFDIFMMLIPVNSLAYGCAVALPLHLLAGRRMVSRK